jgi:hypothetical protein
MQAASPAVEPHSPALVAPRQLLPSDLGDVRQALYATVETTSELCDEIFGETDDQTPACMLFSDPEFSADLAHCGFDDDEILMLQLSADASQSATVSYLAASPAMAVPPLKPPRHDQSRFKLDDTTSREIAETAPPSTQREIDALKGTTQGNLILEAQVDEVLSMIREGRVVPRDIRTLQGRFSQMDGKWVVKYKKKLSGLLERVRARWTLRGDKQVPHRDYDPDNIYSPVATKTTHFALFVLAVQYSLMLFCLDVSKAFMMGPIDKPGIFIRPPFGFSNAPHPDFCPFGKYTTYELLCSLYGLKQAAAVYYATVRALVLAYRFEDGSAFQVSPADPCAFVHGRLGTDHYIAFSTHIDDKFIACKTLKDRDVVTSIFDTAGWKFTIQTMDCVLGVSIKYAIYNPFTGDGGYLRLSHRQSITDAFKKYSPEIPKDRRGSRNIPVSSDTISAINAQGTSSMADYNKERQTLFRSILGTVSHITNFTHPECAFAVSFASQFLANPSEMHLTMILGVLLYLYDHRDETIVFSRQSQPTVGSPITVLCDSDLGNSIKKRSRTGLLAYFFGNLVHWCSRLQPSVSLSTSEAEYMALAAAGRFAVWFKMLAGDLGVESAYHEPVNVYSDNKSAIEISRKPITHKHSRHIDRRLHWLREVTRPSGPVPAMLKVGFIPTAENVSDAMTKALPNVTFKLHRRSLFEGFKFTAEAKLPNGMTFLVLLEGDYDAILDSEMQDEL